MKRYKTVEGIPLIEENRFSVYVAEKDDADLLRWKAWFSQANIPSVIALTTDGYALYRLGLGDA